MKTNHRDRSRKARVSNLPAVRAALAERDAAHAEAARLTAISDQLGTPEAEQAARQAQHKAAAAYDRHVEAWYEADAALYPETAADAAPEAGAAGHTAPERELQAGP
jgi:hypothetical protein